jgi:putative component of toxin-antitoxin plasmid stabilization module
MIDKLFPKGYIPPMLEVRRTEAFTSWLDALRDERAKARIA